MLTISSLSVGCRNNVLILSLERQSEKCLCEYFMLFFCSFSYRGKVIIKGVSSIIGIGYSITIIKGHYSCYTGCYSFQRDKGFDSSPCVLNIIPTSFKLFIIIRLFTFLFKGGEQISIFFVVSVKFLFQCRVLKK